jgi:hypothetical protein
MSEVLLGERELAALKIATHRLLVDNGGPVTAEFRCRVNAPRLSTYQSRNHPKDIMPIDVVLQLQRRDDGSVFPVVTQTMARLQGYDLVPIASSGDGLVPSALARLGAEVSALFGEAALALADGSLDEAERERLRSRACEARRVLAQLEFALAPEAA